MNEMVNLADVLNVIDKYLDMKPDLSRLILEINHNILKLPRVNKLQWISVEERLPHYLDHVLCVNKFGIQMVGYLTDYKEGRFRCESGMDSCDYITHWMPLPEPPKEVE